MERRSKRKLSEQANKHGKGKVSTENTKDSFRIAKDDSRGPNNLAWYGRAWYGRARYGTAHN